MDVFCAFTPDAVCSPTGGGEMTEPSARVNAAEFVASDKRTDAETSSYLAMFVPSSRTLVVPV
jgi:hypothetical protein